MSQPHIVGSFRIVTLVLALALGATAADAAGKSYQVTGPVLAVTDTIITVQKGKEKWEIERSAATKVTGELKVGAKITVYYRMVADEVEAKADAKADAKAPKIAPKK